MDSDEEDDFVIIGTPLPSLLEDEVPKKPTPYKEQAVKDAKGRAQRFHGAFTGGFSAGFYNTVGTEQGWAPSTFVSSRSQKSEPQVAQRPEDFMDAEDFSEHGIAPKKISTTDIFGRQAAAAKGGLAPDAQGILGSAALQDLVVPADSPMGVKLLRRLGWKEGQGVGPRVKRRKRKQQLGATTIGCALPPTGSSEESSDDEYAAGLTFAPKDTNPVTFEPKDNFHGIGYSGIDVATAMSGGGGVGGHINLFKPPPPISKTGKRGISGHAFGVGALEDEDEDIYATDSMANYDFAAGGEGSSKTHGWTAPRGQDSLAKINQTLQGFKLSDKKSYPKKVYPPPQLPKTFRPFHKPKPDTVDARKQTEVPSADTRGKHQHTADSRGALLGEKPVIGSVFDLVSDVDKENIKIIKDAASGAINQQTEKGTTRQSRFQPPSSATGKSATNLPSSQPTGTAATNLPGIRNIQFQAPSTSTVASATNLAESTEHTSTNLSTGPSAGLSPTKLGDTSKAQPMFPGGAGLYAPFAKDPAKQQRYDLYKELKKQGCDDPFKAIHSGPMTEWEKEREREEFARAAMLYKPMSGLMASRFTRGQFEDMSVSVAPSEKKQPESEQAKAAEMGMFGPLTRETVEWHPANVLCRRFNVPNPYPDSTTEGTRKVQQRSDLSVFGFLTAPNPASHPVPAKSEVKAIEAPPETQDQDTNTEYNLNEPLPARPGVVQTEEEGRDGSTSPVTRNQEGKAAKETEEEPPPLDLFKAIFQDSASSSSSSESEEEAAEVETSMAEGSTAVESNKPENSVVVEKGQTLTSTVIESEGSKAADQQIGSEIQVSSAPPKHVFVRRKPAASDKVSDDNEVQQDKETSHQGDRENTLQARLHDSSLHENQGDAVQVSLLESCPHDNQGDELQARLQESDPHGNQDDALQARLREEGKQQGDQEMEVDAAAASYGPALPPGFTGDAAPSTTFPSSISPAHRKQKSKQKVKKKKKEKHKKKKSKHKKEKHKHKKSKKEPPEGSSSSSGKADSELSEDEDGIILPSDRELLHRMREASGGKRLTAADFM